MYRHFQFHVTVAVKEEEKPEVIEVLGPLDPEQILKGEILSAWESEQFDIGAMNHVSFIKRDDAEDSPFTVRVAAIPDYAEHGRAMEYLNAPFAKEAL